MFVHFVLPLARLSFHTRLDVSAILRLAWISFQWLLERYT